MMRNMQIRKESSDMVGMNSIVSNQLRQISNMYQLDPDYHSVLPQKREASPQIKMESHKNLMHAQQLLGPSDKKAVF